MTTIPKNNNGYGSSPRCSSLQQQWQTEHPIFLAVKKGSTIKDYLKQNPMMSSLVSNPALLLPSETPSLVYDKPKLIDYVQLPLYLWVPDFFLPHLVPFMPCVYDDCNGFTTRQRWRSGGPRLIHDLTHGMYLHCQDYVCQKHPNEVFAGWDERSIRRLHQSARATFKFVLTAEEGVTMDLFNRIINARMTGSSFQALRNELVQARYDRLYGTIAAYYKHCEDYRQISEASPIRQWFGGFGVVTNSAEANYYMPPDLHNPVAYFDHLPPAVSTFSEIYQRYCQQKSPLWMAYTQQLTAERVSIDATFKIANKINKSNLTRCWSMIDIDTGVILHQQLLTHESHREIYRCLVLIVLDVKPSVLHCLAESVVTVD